MFSHIQTANLRKIKLDKAWETHRVQGYQKGSHSAESLITLVYPCSYLLLAEGNLITPGWGTEDLTSQVFASSRNGLTMVSCRVTRAPCLSQNFLAPWFVVLG
jgi:hypothetical protein